MRIPKKFFKAISGSIGFILVGIAFLAIGTATIVKYCTNTIKAWNYIPQEVTVIDADNSLKETDQLKEALKKYSEKAGISIKLVVNYKYDNENGKCYTDRLETLPEGSSEDAEAFLYSYDSRNKLSSDDRTLVIGMTYDANSLNFIEFSGTSGTDRKNRDKLRSSQSRILRSFQEKNDKGMSPEQAVIDTVEENLKSVELYVPLSDSKRSPSEEDKTFKLNILFTILGLALLSSAVRKVRAALRSDPMQEALDWYANKPSRSAPLPDKENEDYYSDLFGGGQENDKD